MDEKKSTLVERIRSAERYNRELGPIVQKTLINELKGSNVALSNAVEGQESIYDQTTLFFDHLPENYHHPSSQLDITPSSEQLSQLIGTVPLSLPRPINHHVSNNLISLAYGSIFGFLVSRITGDPEDYTPLIVGASTFVLSNAWLYFIDGVCRRRISKSFESSKGELLQNAQYLDERIERLYK